MILRLLALIIVVATLTAITQIGGVVLIIALVLGRTFRWQGGKGALGVAATFAIIYAGSTLLLVPSLAAIGGRVPLPCAGEPLRTLPAMCVLNRHYVSPKLRALAEALASGVDREYPGSITVALDANFPFLDGFPLLPHLSHDDGNKLDFAFYYADTSGRYAPGATRSFFGYWAFETPAKDEETACGEDWLSLRWDMTALQPLFPKLSLDPQRTRLALNWLFEQGRSYGLQRVFIEPYLARRLHVSSDILGFQGCRAARHDDHVHVQIAAEG